jgi:hypothetical protein
LHRPARDSISHSGNGWISFHHLICKCYAPAVL